MNSGIICTCGKAIQEGLGVCPWCQTQTPLVLLETGNGLMVDMGMDKMNPVLVEDFRYAQRLVSMGYPNVVKLGDLISIKFNGKSSSMTIHPRGGQP